MKDYMKPAISFQFFNLAANAPGGCSLDSNSAQYQCAVEIPGRPGMTIFANRPDCRYLTDSPEDYGVCYGVPVADSRVLGS